MTCRGGLCVSGVGAGHGLSREGLAQRLRRATVGSVGRATCWPGHRGGEHTTLADHGAAGEHGMDGGAAWRRLNTAAKALGKQLEFRRTETTVYFWSSDGRRRGRPRKNPE